MEQNTKSGFSGNSILTVTKEDDGKRTRFVLKFHGENMFNPDMKGAIGEILAQNVALAINSFESENDRLPYKDEIQEHVIRRSVRETREEVLKFVAKAALELMDELLDNHTGFVFPAIDRAQDILNNEVGVADESK